MPFEFNNHIVDYYFLKMVCMVNHDTDNIQCRLLTIQRPGDSKWREKVYLRVRR